MVTDFQQRARADVSSTLSMVPHFATMSSAEQLDLYRQLVDARATESRAPHERRPVPVDVPPRYRRRDRLDRLARGRWSRWRETW